MKIFKAAVLFAAAAVMLAGLALGVAAGLYYKPHTVKQALVSGVQQQLGRRVAVGGVETHLLHGIVLHDVVIDASYPWERGPLLECRRITMQCSLAALLLKKLVIRNVALQRPALQIGLDHGGSFRFFGRGSRKKIPGAPLDMLFLPAGLALTDAAATVTTPAGMPPLQFSSVQATARNISIIRPFPFSVTAEIDTHSSSLACRGTASLSKKSVTAKMRFEEVRTDLLKYFITAPDFVVSGGTLSGDATIAIAPEKPVSLQGTLELEQFALPPASSRPGLDNAGGRLSFDADYDPVRKKLTLDTADGEFIGSPVSLGGTLTLHDTRKTISAVLQSGKLSLDELFARLRLPSELPLAGARLAGNARLEMRLAGPIGPSLFPTLLLTFNRNRVIYPPLGGIQPSLSGSIRMDRNDITLTDLKIATENMSFTLAGDVNGYRSGFPKSNVRVVSSVIDFERMIEYSDESPAGDIGPFDLGGLVFDGPIRLGAITFFGLPMSDVGGRYLLKDNTLSIKDFSGNIDDGRFSLAVNVDLGTRGLDYYAYIKFSRAPLKRIITAYAPEYAQFLDGRASGTCALKGTGTSPVRFLDSLKGDAVITVTDSAIKGVDLIPELARFVKADRLSAITFNRAELQLRLRSGRIDADGFFAGPDLELLPSGEIGLDSSLDMTADVYIAPDIFSDDLKIAKYLPRRGNRISLPITIRGSLQKPEAALAEETLNYLIQESLPRMLLDMLSENADSAEESGTSGQ